MNTEQITNKCWELIQNKLYCVYEDGVEVINVAHNGINIYIELQITDYDEYDEPTAIGAEPCRTNEFTTHINNFVLTNDLSEDDTALQITEEVLNNLNQLIKTT